MDLSIIIVNWNSKDYLQKCIASIIQWTKGIDYEILVIDNASYDGVKEMLQNYFPEVRFIQSEKNIGFAKANNMAFTMSNGQNILFLNPDTELHGSGILILNYWLNSLPDAGVVGAKLLNSDLSIQTSSIHAFPTIINQVLDSNALRNTFPNAEIWGTGPLYRECKEPPAVEAVSGACLMIKRSVFEKVRMFSSDYFMYSEDIDLCFKAKETGWKVYYIPMATIIHHVGRSSLQRGKNVFPSVMMLESRWRFFRKTRSPWYCWCYRIAMCCSSILRIVTTLIVWPIYGILGRSSLGWNIIEKWSARLRWTLGGERWVKNY